MSDILVYGLGVTGVSTVKTLAEMGYRVYTYDKNIKENEQLKGYTYSPLSSEEIFKIKYDFVVKSPGIPPHDDIMIKLYDKYEVISDIELAYRLFPNKKIIGITGSNGKTTTTSLVTHILNLSGNRAISVGNIGEGICWQMYKNDCTFVCELSSFQLHDVINYHTNIGLILNISPDHLDWHENYDDYIQSKMNITKNQNENDNIIINREDAIINSKKSSFKAKIYEFSSKEKVKRGSYLSNNNIYIIDYNKDFKIINCDRLNIIGIHNYENAMAAILACYLYGISLDDIRQGLKTFKSIEHRLEYVDTINSIKVYNDSKATNVDSAIKAINSFNNNLIVIAGGYDKKIDYTDFIKEFKKNGKAMILLGQTKFLLKNLCIKYDVDYYLVDNMKEAVNVAFQKANSGDVILLSPASASWGMYDNYQQRGEDFKKEVRKFKECLK